MATTETPYTPGPWNAQHVTDESGEGWWAVVPVEEGMKRYIPHKVCECGFDNDPDAEANARLISASPDLLAVCEHLVNFVLEITETARKKGPIYYTEPDFVAMARAAIAKATGGTDGN